MWFLQNALGDLTIRAAKPVTMVATSIPRVPESNSKHPTTCPFVEDIIELYKKCLISPDFVLDGEVSSKS